MFHNKLFCWAGATSRIWKGLNKGGPLPFGGGGIPLKEDVMSEIMKKLDDPFCLKTLGTLPKELSPEEKQRFEAICKALGKKIKRELKKRRNRRIRKVEIQI